MLHSTLKNRIYYYTCLESKSFGSIEAQKRNRLQHDTVYNDPCMALNNTNFKTIIPFGTWTKYAVKIISQDYRSLAQATIFAVPFRHKAKGLYIEQVCLEHMEITITR